MKVVNSAEEVSRTAAESSQPVGFVATMGALHEGHLALVRRARAENATLVASIFVNPAQFGPLEDFATYPRDVDSDLSTLEELGADLVFAPSAEEMYPEGFDTYVDVGRIGRVLEGWFRPNHFRGVATVVCKLLAIVGPDRTYFGQKDAQQVLVVKQLVADLNLGVEILVVPTVREADGLALSSRNVVLGPEERKAAPVMYRSLSLAKSLRDQGHDDAGEIRRQMRALIEREPLARIDYVSIADATTLEELDRIDRPSLASLAVHVGPTRLIDNITLQ